MATFLSRNGYVRVSLALLLVLAVIGLGLYLYLGGPKGSSSASAQVQEEGGTQEIPVKVVKPHYDKEFTMTVRRPADVLPYYRDELESLVPGTIGMIRTDKGDVVKEGDKLIVIDVPDLQARLKEAEAAWHLAEAQVEQKNAAVECARAELDVVEAKINAAIAKRNSDAAYLKFRSTQAKRYKELLATQSIDARLVDEQEDRREAAFESLNASEEAVKQARAQKVAASAKVDQAKADLKEATRRVEVAKADQDYSQAQVNFATITAPFDGVIVDRNRRANKGAIVQKAETGNPKPLLTIQRSDIVTVAVRVPDNYAPFITPNTEAIFETTALPGVKIHGKVTRFPPSLLNPQNDRTMVVEVDLWNGPAGEYAGKMADEKFTSRLKKGMPGDPKNGLPILPQFKGNDPKIKEGKDKLSDGRQLRLLPGMFGEMSLVLQKFENAYLLPSASIVMSGGNPYIYVVRDGKAHLQAVKVQVDDGKLAKVERLNAAGEVAGDLTGDEIVVVTNTGELSEGQPVRAALIQDWHVLQDSKEAKK